MSVDSKPTKVQLQIGRTASIDLQEWVENQSLPINKAVKEALEQFVRAYGTADIRSEETRKAMSNQTRVISQPVANPNITETYYEVNTKQSLPPDDGGQKKKKKIMNRDIDI